MSSGNGERDKEKREREKDKGEVPCGKAGHQPG